MVFRRVSLTCLPLTALSCLVLAAVPQVAWSAEWLAPNSGSWVDGSNWSSAPHYPGGPVVGAIPATINGNGSPFAVSLATPIRIDDLMLGAENLTLNLSGGAIDVGLKGQPHELDCEFFPCSGPVLPPDGINYIEGIPADLIVGQTGAGSSVEQLGGTIKVTDRVHIGSAAGEVGEYTISGGNLEITKYWDYESCCYIPGPGAWLQRGGDFRVGEAGSGTLNIQDGATVKIPADVASSLGGLPGAQGTVRVEGPGSKWTVAQTIGDSGGLRTIVGREGTGTLVIQDGGVAMLDSITVGQSSTGSGTVTVTGIGSQLILDESLSIGAGQVHAFDGAKLLPDFGVGVSPQSRATAQLVVEGSGTVVDGWLYVAASGGNASAIIRDGALATTYWAFVGGTGGKITVDGPGTEWRILADHYVPHINSYLNVAATGGSVEITNGAHVVSQMSKIGLGDGSGGIVALDGPATRWDNLTSIYVGGGAPENAPNISFGVGVLRLTNGATVSVGGVLKLWPTGRLEGSGTVDGNVDNSGAIEIGQSAGQLAIDGNLNHAGVLEFEIGGLVASEFDQLEVSGDATLSGSLQVSLIDQFFPRASDTFAILTAGSLIGAFSNAAPGTRLETVDGTGSFLVNYGPASSFPANQIVLSHFFPSGQPGDYNDDGLVDAGDYTTWRNEMGATGPGLAADGNNDHIIDDGDYLVWKANFGTSASGTGSLSHSPVPEPATVVFLALAALVLMRRREINLHQTADPQPTLPPPGRRN